MCYDDLMLTAITLFLTKSTLMSCVIQCLENDTWSQNHIFGALCSIVCSADCLQIQEIVQDLVEGHLH